MVCFSTPLLVGGAALLLAFLPSTARGVVVVEYDCAKGPDLTERYTREEMEEIWQLAACILDEWHDGNPVDLSINTVLDSCGTFGIGRSTLDRGTGCGSRSTTVRRSLEYCAPMDFDLDDGRCIINELEGCDWCTCESCTSGVKYVFICKEHEEWCDQCEAQDEHGVNCGCRNDPEHVVCMQNGARPGGRFGLSDLGFVEVNVQSATAASPKGATSAGPTRSVPLFSLLLMFTAFGGFFVESGAFW